MSSLKPYDGEIIPLSKEEEERLTPYTGELLPLEDGDMGSPLEKEVTQSHIQKNVDLGIDGPKGEEAVTLPPVTDEMYTDAQTGQPMDPDQAMSIYNAYSKHPHSQKDWLGNVTYQGKPVSKPSNFSNDLADSGVGMIAGSLWQAGKDAIGTGLALGEELTPNEDDGTITRVGKVLGTMALGPISTIATVMRGDQSESFDEIVPDFNPTSPVDKAVSGAVQFGAGALAGDRGMSKLGLAAKAGEGLLKKGGKFLTRVFGGEIAGNLTLDHNTETAIIGNAKNDKIIQGLVFDENGEYSRDRLNQKLVQIQDGILLSSIIGTVAKPAGVVLNMTAIPWTKHLMNWGKLEPEKKKIVGELTQIVSGLNENSSKEEVLDVYSNLASYMKDHEKEVISLGGAIEGPDAEIMNDSVTSLISFLKDKNPEKYSTEIEMLQEIRASALGTGSPNLKVNLEKGREVLDDTLTKVQTQRNYKKTIPQATENIQSGAEREMARNNEAIDQTREMLETTRAEGDEIIKRDSAFSGAKDSYIEFNPKQQVDKIEEDIISTTNQNRKSIEKEADKEYNRIHPTAKVSDDFRKKFDDLRDIIPEDIQKSYGKADGNFRDIVRYVKPELKKYISTLYKDGKNRNSIVALEDLSESLSGASTLKANEQLAKADANYKKTVGPYREGLPEDLRKAEKKLKPGETMRDSRKAVRKTLDDPDSKELVTKARQLLDMTKKGDLIDDYYVGNAATKVRQTYLDTEKFDVDQIRKAFEPARRGMSEAGQERFETLMNDLSDNNKSVADKEIILDDLIKKSDAAKEEIYENVLRDFFEKRGGEYSRSKLDGHQIFENIMKRKDSVSSFMDIMKRDPFDNTTKKAFESAWAREYQRKIFSNKDFSSVGKTPDDDAFYELGEKLFNKDAIDGIKKIKEIAKTGVLANRTRMGQGIDILSNDRNAKSAMNSVVSFLWGHLNPKTVKIRLAANQYMKNKNATEVAKEASDKILSNAGTFSDVLQGMIKEQRSKLSPSDKKLIRRTFIPAIKSANTDEDTEEQTKRMFGK